MRIKTWAVYCVVSLSSLAAEPPPLRLVQTIPLPGVRGRFDHFAIDLKAQRVFVAALGNNTVEILDVAGGKRGGTLTGLRKPQDVAYLPSRNQFVVASGDDGTVKFCNASTYAVEHTLTSLDDADNV